MSAFFGLSDRGKLVKLLCVLLERCTEQAETPYLRQLREDLQILVNKQSKATIRICVLEAMSKLTASGANVQNVLPENSEKPSTAFFSARRKSDASDEIAFQVSIKTLFVMQSKAMRSESFVPMSSYTGEERPGEHVQRPLDQQLFPCTGFESEVLTEEILNTDALRTVFEPKVPPSTNQNDSGRMLQLFHHFLASLKHKDIANARGDLYKIGRLVRNNIDTTPWSTEFYGFQFFINKKYFEATLFYWIAATLYDLEDNPKESVIGFRKCVDSLNQINVILNQNGESNSPIIKHHVLLLMHEIKKMCCAKIGVNMHFKCKSELFVFHFVEWSENLIKDWESRRQTLTEAIQRVAKIYGNAPKRLLLYGDLLCHLGYTYARLSQYDEAIRYFKLSLEVYCTADDPSTPEEKLKRIQDGQLNLDWTMRRKMFAEKK